MEQLLFYQLSLVIAVAAGISLIFKQLRQPLIIGYILTGFVAGPTLLGLIHNHEAFTSFSQIGIALLLFTIGLGLNPGVIRTAGKPVFMTFLTVAVGIGLVAFGASKVLGFSTVESLVLAVALLFSSTIVVVKSLSDKKEQSRLYGQIAIGILLVEDIIASIALVFLSAQSGAGSSAVSADFGMMIVKGGLLAAALILFGGYVLPRSVNLFASSQELLFISALAWAFGVASIFRWYGFSIEVGALFAGVTIAHISYAQEISTRLKPLRDFFIVLFFVELGQNLGLNSISSAIIPAIILSLIVICLKPLIILVSLGSLGYTKQTGFKAAVHLSQISEFSIVFVVLAVTTGVAGERLIAVITLTAIITIILSAYLMNYDDKLYALWQKRLSVFERSRTKREVRTLRSYPLVLLGYRNGGYEFIETFREMKKRYVVIDYDPDVVESLEHQHINHLYGDVTDLELLGELNIHTSELIVSMLTDNGANMMLVEHITRYNPEAIFVCHATTYDDAIRLYEKGAAYVLLPHVIGSERINSFIRRHGSHKTAFDSYRRKHLQALMRS